MIFTKTPLDGAYLVELQQLEDERGFFARSFCQHEFEENGLNPNVVQCNISYNLVKGTLRGMHFQAAPHEEAKLVSCIQGAIYDVIIDIRPHSHTYMHHFAIELTAEKHNALFVPEGFAHGFLTMEPHTSVFYQMSEFYAPHSARGFRWNDPAFNLQLPIAIGMISKRDAELPNFSTDLL
jgi:dTDP-4-dehydrorhamnose 3,5-epimerase